jgi:hypothetical protein
MKRLGSLTLFLAAIAVAGWMIWARKRPATPGVLADTPAALPQRAGVSAECAMELAVTHMQSAGYGRNSYQWRARAQEPVPVRGQGGWMVPLEARPKPWPVRQTKVVAALLEAEIFVGADGTIDQEPSEIRAW